MRWHASLPAALCVTQGEFLALSVAGVPYLGKPDNHNVRFSSLCEGVTPRHKVGHPPGTLLAAVSVFEVQTHSHSLRGQRWSLGRAGRPKSGSSRAFEHSGRGCGRGLGRFPVPSQSPGAGSPAVPLCLAWNPPQPGPPKRGTGLH